MPFWEDYSTAMHSISILASKGSAATWYVDRAGAGEGKSAKYEKVILPPHQEFTF